MRKRGILMLGLACVMGVAAVYLARGWLETRMKSSGVSERSVPATTVVVARRALSFGDHVKAEFLQEIEWPASAVPSDAFKTVAELVGTGETRVVLRTVEVNEPILKTKISGFGGKATLSAIIGPDMRAVTVRVNDVVGVAGFVLPGDRVDVLLTRKQLVMPRDEQPYTDVLLQSVKVLAVDQEANEKSQKPVVAKAVTLEVTPHQAQKLTLAAQVGYLSLALRKDTNVEAAPLTTVNLRDLRPYVEPVIAFNKPVENVAPRLRVTQVNIVRGFKATIETVPVEEPPMPVKRLQAKASDKNSSVDK